eukprot:TRINITY_DN13574_c0_g1_i3.p1 TRINITY_DN13574_c0_g1~~TRINITY_DN13574_c0_g1_i3.p1  ORF type:complete len:105 (-),score=10.97 TRINITY_DN13574_c0_g1_i3:263-577(-)
MNGHDACHQKFKLDLMQHYSGTSHMQCSPCNEQVSKPSYETMNGSYEYLHKSLPIFKIKGEDGQSTEKKAGFQNTEHKPKLSSGSKQIKSNQNTEHKIKQNYKL